MKKIKRFLISFFIMFVSIVLVACSGVSKKTFVNYKSEVVVEYNKNKVNKITVDLEESFKDEKQSEDYISKMKKTVADAGEGLEFKSSMDKGTVHLTLTINTDKIEPDKFKQKNILPVDDVKSLELVEKFLKEHNYKEKK